MANLLDAVNDLRDAIAKYCAIRHNWAADDFDTDPRTVESEARLDKALRATHHLHEPEGVEEIHISEHSLTITTDTGRTFEVARNTRYIA